MAEAVPKLFTSSTPKSQKKRTAPLGTPFSDRKRPRKADSTQAVLDAGQSKIGLEHCSECGMTYNVDHENDVKAHNDYHNRYNSTKLFQLRTTQVEQWKKLVKYVKLSNPIAGTIFVVQQDSKCHSMKNKIGEIVQEHIDSELGFCEDVPIWKKDRVALLLITDLEPASKTHQLIAGIALVDPVEKVMLQPMGKFLKRGSYVGVNRLWIQQSMRRKNLATMLTNTARPILYPGIPMSETRAAFYDPTADGLKFVLAYFGRQGRYLTYEEDDS